MSNRRESAHAFVQRLRATPVALSPHVFHNATDGGLRQSDVLFVGGRPGSGKTTWIYRVAAQHVHNGGCVTFLFLPGSGNFVLRRFMEQLEMVTPLSITTEKKGNDTITDNHNNNNSDNDEMETPCISDIEARREALLNALNRVEVVHCADVVDLAIYCMHETRSTLDATLSHTAVPLVIAEGCGGKGSYLHHMERAMGHESPLCHWLFNCLQRRRRCALILVEEWGFAEVEWDGRPRSSGREEESSFTAIVETESELLRRLQKEKTFRATKIPKHFTTKRQRMSSNSGVNSSTLTETSSHLVGNLRLFYLHMQSVPTVTTVGGGFVTVARLLQWRLMQKQQTTDENNEISEVLTEFSRQQRWRQSPLGKSTPLYGEVLCAAQL
ncbi:hypothetical protein LSM04_002602 [Trypanosoma melophagium]|uniref:uncharacterized protein n=1 Tax=Trypanosoma melophagium TaxID=715481 RepID=UPI003519E485|nr:hypothetical protein LSM04_002602 [Trypanosoma melophagium]